MFQKLAFLWCLLATTTVHAGQNVVVVLDDSGSMNDRMARNYNQAKMDAAKPALLTVLEELPADAKVGVLLLNGGWRSDRWVHPLATVDAAKLRKAIQGIKAHGGTPLGERMKEGCDALLSLRDKEHYGFYRLLIVTDGEATDSDLVVRYLPDILSRGIWVDVIGVDMARDHSLATEVHTYRKADDQDSLEQAIAEVLAESTGDSRDAGQSDFEIIASIPEGLAAAALEALSASGNHPIGEEPPLAPDVQADVASGARPGPVVPGDPRRPPIQQRDRGGPEYGAWVLGGICLVAVVFFVLVVSKKSKRP
jgi:hypothetical protein